MQEVEEEEELKAILRDAFGDSSSESDGARSPDWRGRIQASDSSDEIVRLDSIFGDSPTWEPITEINGLWICRDLLSGDQQSSLLCALEKEGYLVEALHNQGLRLSYWVKSQPKFRDPPAKPSIWHLGESVDDATLHAMRFGDLPPWALELSYIIRESVVMSDYFSESTSDERKETCLFPSELLRREPLFNQLIVNIYQPGEGICAHVDLMRFEDGIAIISLESSCVMHFTSVETEVSHKIPVLLTPGSVVFMWGDARFLWKHEINRKLEFQNWRGQELNQKRRTSVTLRRLRQTD